MMKITLIKIEKENCKLTYRFDYSNDLSPYFNNSEEFSIEYENVDITHIPENILVIPFLCNILPISWILDATIHIPEVDKNFYESISDFKNGYIQMYPKLSFAGDVLVDEIVNNTTISGTGSNLMFFSGGVDAFNTLIHHIEEKPVFMTLWGSDIGFYNTEGWSNIKNHVVKVAERFSLECKFIKSTFRGFINEWALSKLVGRDYWGYFQHGIGIIGHAAPLAYEKKSNIVYIASTNSAKDKEKALWASDPAIDNFVKWKNTQVLHDGYEFSRQDKVRNICSFAQENPDIKVVLRVCYTSLDGKNCCSCEKCYRTTMALLAESQNPNDYGLYYSVEHNKKIKNDIILRIKMHSVQIAFWRDIQERFLENTNILVKHPELKWIIKIDFKTINSHPLRQFKRGIRFIKKIIKVIKKIIKAFMPYGLLKVLKKI